MGTRSRIAVLLAAISCVAASWAVTVSVDSISAEGGAAILLDEKAGTNGLSVVALKAVAVEGYSFAGWWVDGEKADWSVDHRLAEVSSVEVPQTATVEASFVPVEDDGFEFDIAEKLLRFDYGETISIPLTVDSSSFPTLAFSGLPAGLKYDSRTMTLAGRLQASGIFNVKVTGTNASGYRFSQFFQMTVGNRVGNGLMGHDVEVPIGEYVVFDFALVDTGKDSPGGYLFECSSPRRATRLSGLPAGMTWDEELDILYGTPTKAGSYAVSATVTYSNGVSTAASLLFSVTSPSPSDYGFPLDALDDLVVGDELEADSAELGTYTNGVGLVSVSGLPPGLSLVSGVDADGVRHLGVSGCVRTAGRYTALAKISVREDGEVRTVTVPREIIVGDSMMTYLKVGYYGDQGPEIGTIVGGGPVSIGQTVQVKATPKTGYVFAGWYLADEDPVELPEGQDYRDAQLTFVAGTDFSDYRLFGRFIPKGDDDLVIGEELLEANLEFSSDGELDEEFSVISGSRPTLTFKGLPAGVAAVPIGNGGFSLRYNAETTSQVPSPGRYNVVLTAVNKSGAKDTLEFSMAVENWYDNRVDVEDDYGDFSPGYEITPIDLNGVVDFANGESVTVSGLPKGLVFNRTANEKKGIFANSITGTPTAPGDYTLVFKAKVAVGEATNSIGRIARTFETVTVTSSIRILPWPALEVAVDSAASDAGCKITGSGNYKPNSKVTMTAKPAPGWVFAGWSELDEITELAAKNPTLSMVTGEEDTHLEANFVPVSEDYLVVDSPVESVADSAAEWQVGVDVAEQGDEGLIAALIETVSYPTVAVSGLPPGVRFNGKELLLSGSPTKSGVFYATVSAKNLGGYSFVRVLRLTVLGKDGVLPGEIEFPNAAAMDCSPLEALMTGVHYPVGSVVLSVPCQPESGAGVRKVAVSGLPAGLSATTRISEDGAFLMVTGTPTKPGRVMVSFTVTYENGKSAKAQHAVVVEDGGSYCLSVVSGDEVGGTVTGGGVYASGAMVKLSAKPSAKHVFAGWRLPNGELFSALPEIDGVDPRTASVTFPFRPGLFDSELELRADFLPIAEDLEPRLEMTGSVWSVANGEASAFGCRAVSASLPKWTVKGLPKGLVFDIGRECFVYDGQARVVPGIYSVTVSAINQSKGGTGLRTFEVQVANLTSPVIHGISSELDAYPLTVGTIFPEGALSPFVDEGWTLAVKGLPAGLSYKNGRIVGVPSKTGNYTMTIVATSGSGRDKIEETATVTVSVSALPRPLIGTFNGFVFGGEDGRQVQGTVTASVTAAGRISLKIATVAGNTSFSASAWNAIDDQGVAFVEMETKNGAHALLRVDSRMGWQEWQLSGEVDIEGVAYRVEAQRNAFDAVTGEEEAIASAKRLKGTYVWDDITCIVKANGTVSFSGKREGSMVSGSTSLFYDEGLKIKIFYKTKNSFYFHDYVIVQ